MKDTTLFLVLFFALVFAGLFVAWWIDYRNHVPTNNEPVPTHPVKLLSEAAGAPMTHDEQYRKYLVQTLGRRRGIKAYKAYRRVRAEQSK